MDASGRTEALDERGYCSAAIIVVASLLDFDTPDDYLGKSSFVAQDVERREASNGASACGGVKYASA